MVKASKRLVSMATVASAAFLGLAAVPASAYVAYDNIKPNRVAYDNIKPNRVAYDNIKPNRVAYDNIKPNRVG